MSARAAWSGAKYNPVPKPVTIDNATTNHSVSAKPKTIVPTPQTAVPAINNGRRPNRSLNEPLNETETALPTANIVIAKPALKAPKSCAVSVVKTAVTNNGTNAIRTPKLAQPFIKPEYNEVR